MIEKLKTILSVHRKENVECLSNCFCWDIDTFIFFNDPTSEFEYDTHPPSSCPKCHVEKYLTIAYGKKRNDSRALIQARRSTFIKYSLDFLRGEHGTDPRNL